METRAHHLLIGGFVLLFVTAAVAFVLWLASAGLDRDSALYDIYFEDSVAGLPDGGDVRYRGIKVGTVTDIGINPGDPTRARVTVDLGSTPIREGDEATLVLQGITGVLFINIEGATRESPPLTARAGQAHPVIPSRPSAISEVFASLPELLAKAAIALDNLGGIVDQPNRERIAGILGNLDGITAALAAREDQAGRILDALERSSGHFEGAASSIEGTLATADRLLSEEAPAMVVELKATSANLQALLADAEAMLAENREPLHEFTTQGLGELSAVAVETRRLLARLSRLIERLESEGAGFLLGPQPRELEAEP